VRSPILSRLFDPVEHPWLCSAKKVYPDLPEDAVLALRARGDMLQLEIGKALRVRWQLECSNARPWMTKARSVFLISLKMRYYAVSVEFASDRELVERFIRFAKLSGGESNDQYLARPSAEDDDEPPESQPMLLYCWLKDNLARADRGVRCQCKNAAGVRGTCSSIVPIHECGRMDADHVLERRMIVVNRMLEIPSTGFSDEKGGRRFATSRSYSPTSSRSIDSCGTSSRSYR
jgi:hypothetical protein